MAKCCFVLDPLDRIKPYKDSSVALMVEAEARGLEVYAAEFSDFSIENGAVRVFARRTRTENGIFEQKAAVAPFFRQDAAETLDVDGFGFVFIRKDPPFDRDYLSLTLVLSNCEDRVRIVNAPRGLRDVSEKLVVTRFSDFAPQTLVTYSAEKARAFAAERAGVVLKPSYFGAGAGVMKSAADDPNFARDFEATLATEPRGPVIVQEFLPEISKGDTRVMMIDGVVEGAVGRRPAEGEFRANIAAGGSEVAAELTDRQRAVCAEIGPFLRAHGIFFAGVDFIGDWLIEINVTSPTLIQELRRVTGVDIAKVIWDRLGA